MPKKTLLRREIIQKYYKDVHPAGNLIPDLPEGLNQTGDHETFGVSFHTEGSPEHKAPQGDASADSVAAIATEGFKIKPMLHQEVTAQEIYNHLQRGVTTAVLGDPLGAGKTFEALWVFLTLRRDNPDLHMVVTVPDVVVADWKDALSSIGIPKSNCQAIMTPRDIASLDLQNLPTVLFVKQSLKLNQYSSLHQL